MSKYMEHDWDVPQYYWGRHTCKRCGLVQFDDERLVPCGAVDTTYYRRNGRKYSTEPHCVKRN